MLAQLSPEFPQARRRCVAEPSALRTPAHPRRAMSGANVSQMHYARKGIVTPEMEFVAIRENTMRLQEAREQGRYGSSTRLQFRRQHSAGDHS